MAKTMKELCKLALDVQDACNLSGVVHSFSAILPDLRALLESEPGFSTQLLNQHPVSLLYSDKIASLTGSSGGYEFSRAYDFAKDMVQS